METRKGAFYAKAMQEQSRGSNSTYDLLWPSHAKERLQTADKVDKSHVQVRVTGTVLICGVCLFNIIWRWKTVRFKMKKSRFPVLLENQ